MISFTNLKTISDVLLYAGFDVNYCTNFWDYLGDSEVTWGSHCTITLIECKYIESILLEYVNVDDDDKLAEKIEEFFKTYSSDYLIIN